MRIFGSDKMIRLMEALGMEDGVPIEHNMVTSSIANAQKRVEGMHFDSRKNLIEYDDVMNQQRKAIYTLRRNVLEGRNLCDRARVKELGMRFAENINPRWAAEHGSVASEAVLDARGEGRKT